MSTSDAKVCINCGKSLEDVFAIYVWKDVNMNTHYFCSAVCKNAYWRDMKSLYEGSEGV